jgi:hypothetical protein
MIDPVSAFALATAAFNGIKKAMEVGRELEDIAGFFGKYFQGVSDVNKAAEEAQNPPLFRKVFSSGSVEEEAMNALIHKKKIEQMESELRQMITLRYGVEAYKEMMQMRRQIREQRERTVYRQEQRRKNFLWNTLYVGLISTLLGCLWWLLVFLTNYKG